MLQTIREHTQGWFAGIIISLVILTFALWGIHSYFVSGGVGSTVAVVNGTNITKEQVTIVYERLRRQAQSPYGLTNGMKNEAQIKSQALRSLIDIEVLKQASLAQGYYISDAQIDNYLQNIPEFQVDGQFSFDKFQQLLASTLLSTGEFLEQIRVSLLIDQPKLGVVFTSFALPEETNYTISLVNQERDIEYATLYFPRFAEKAAVIPLEKTQAYYNEHKQEFMTPEQVSVDYVELNAKDLYSSIQVSDDVLKHYYDENINSYTKPMEWKLADIYLPLNAEASKEEQAKALTTANNLVKAIKQGESFDKLAHEHTSTIKGTDWIKLDQLPAELQKAVYELTKSGQISEPIQTSKGIFIIKVMDVSEPKIQSFDAVKAKVKDAYVHQQAEEKFASLREQLADVSYEHPDSLQAAAKLVNAPIKTSEMFTKEQGGKDISQNKKVRDIAFSNDVLTLQNNSDVIQINPDSVVVLRVKSHLPSNLLELKNVTGQIEVKLRTQKVEQEAEKFANELLAKLNAGADPQQLAKSLDMRWVKTGSLNRYGSKIDSAIVDVAFRLPNPVNVGKKATFGIARVPSGYSIIALYSVKDGTLADEKQFKVFAEQVQNSEGLLEYELYKQSLLKAAKVKITE